VALHAGQFGGFRITARAPSEGREVTAQAWLWVPGPQETSEADADRYLEPGCAASGRERIDLRRGRGHDRDRDSDSANAAGRSLRIALAPSLAGSLLGALDFLTSDPYGCTEQTLSSFLPNLLVTRALTELKLAPTERLSALDRQVSSGLQRLLDMQRQDGGWGWWATDAPHPFMTAYALWGLDEARRRACGWRRTASRTALARSPGCIAPTRVRSRT
jgi:uncharacterized protein YfaS (alpha-2-macroglobulin family)